MRTIDELIEFLSAATSLDARNRIIDTGESWSLMRNNGELRKDAPPIRAAIKTDLLEYGFAVLDACLALRHKNPGNELLRESFLVAGKAFESVVRNGHRTDPERGFHRLISATAYHLGGYAATAFSLFNSVETEEQNLNPAEQCLAKLILRDLDGVLEVAKSWLLHTDNQDLAVSREIEAGHDAQGDPIARIVIAGFCRAMSSYEFALRTGQREFVDIAQELLVAALNISENQGYVALWWVLRITQQLLDDLWASSLHEVVPLHPKSGIDFQYYQNRQIFIASLFSLSTSQVELWPSQIEAAKRASDASDNLVVALPTSAGKTRIAELATLTTLSAGKRVLIITPLRALSAQTERSFRKAFSPLGVHVSSMYGKSGILAGDSSVLRSSHIVVATPEKLDFALRSDPEIISDIGLIVLDEGHLIGPNEREIRYEILVQRLLKRSDASQRRIICLSAILPSGEQLDDMTAWVRSDVAGEPVRSEWRPTRQRFGTLEWHGRSGRLNYDLNDQGPFISGFIGELAARKPETKAYPRDIKDVTLLAAWQFAELGKRSLVYVTQANWVEGFAKLGCKLVNRGYLPNLLEQQDLIKPALAIGTEWLGANHPAVLCLNIGMAIHHGKLPSPFLREVERLLSSGAIKVIVASPTLAQGLNLNAAVLLAPYLVRAGQPIPAEEFANAAGRAGRAFVDSEGLILHVMKDKFPARRRNWKKLVENVQARSLQSGLIAVINQVIARLAVKGVTRSEEAYEYLANSRELWTGEVEGLDGESLESLVQKLDLIVFGLLDALEEKSENLPELLDRALEGSLWARQISRCEESEKTMQLIALRARARLIWNETTAKQRKGHFAMGVGLETGLAIDSFADELSTYVDRADLAAIMGDLESLHENIGVIASCMFSFKPFMPDANKPLPNNWLNILKQWLGGESIAQIGTKNIGIIEDAFVYRLTWAIETIRTRRESNGWKEPEGTKAGAAAACIDSGLPNYRMSMLVRSGLPSRQAALVVIDQLTPDFTDGAELREWLRSEAVTNCMKSPSWPSKETAEIWLNYWSETLGDVGERWEFHTSVYNLPAKVWVALQGSHGRIEEDETTGFSWITTMDFIKVCQMPAEFSATKDEVNFVRFQPDGLTVEVVRIGPGVLPR